MNNFERIKRYYERGLYTLKHMRGFVLAEAITAEQYHDITGEDYSA